jgi:hypothetical protein
MSQISIKGEDGKPIRFAYLDGDELRLQFEYYARDADEGDYEVIQTVLAEDFASIAIKFGLDPKQNILEILQQISDSLRGQELVDALDSKEIKCEVFTWGS